MRARPTICRPRRRVLAGLFLFVLVIGATVGPFPAAAPPPLADHDLALREAAEEGDPEAAYRLGVRLLDGVGSPRQEQEGIRWLTRAAEGGLPEAKLELAVCAFLGRGMPVDQERAAHLLAEATTGWPPERTWWKGIERYLRALRDLPWTRENLHRVVEMMKAFLRLAAQGGHEPSRRALEFVELSLPDKGLIAIGLRGYPPWDDPEVLLADPDEAFACGKSFEAGEDRSERAFAAWWYRVAAEAGHEEAMLRLAFLLQEGAPGVLPRDREEAGRWVRRAARHDLALAVELTGSLESTTGPVEEGERRAAAWFRRAAELGLPEGKASWGYFLLHGRGGVEQDVEQGIRLVREAAAEGSAYALRVLAEAYMKGLGVPRDVDRAVTLIRRAADQGEPGALAQAARAGRQGRLGHRITLEEIDRWVREGVAAGYASSYVEYGSLWEDGWLYPRNMLRAYLWWRLAAEEGDRYAPSLVGACWFYGLGVRRDFREAARWFHRGIEAGSTESMRYLALQYLQGLGVPRDVRAGARLARRAADAGNLRAMVLLAQLYLAGEGVPRDPREAVRWARRAAEGGNPEGMAFLGSAFLQGNGVSRDVRAGEHWLRRAAEMGNLQAQHSLGSLYLGMAAEDPMFASFPVDRHEGLRWLLLAARAGFGPAANDLGWACEAGIGVPVDYRCAWCWYARALELGNTFAAGGLGDLRAAGHGVERDPVRAWAWYELARRGGDGDAVAEHQAKVEGELAPAQLAEARRLADELAGRFLPRPDGSLPPPEGRVVPRPFPCPDPDSPESVPAPVEGGAARGL